MRSIPTTLQRYIDVRDARIAKIRPWSPTPIAQAFNELLATGKTIMGGRASCGGKTDPTWTVFQFWNEVVRKAQAMGFVIERVNIKQPNKSPTMAGGFWNEAEYRLAITAPSPKHEQATMFGGER
jgi:hypothetical protein